MIKQGAYLLSDVFFIQKAGAAYFKMFLDVLKPIKN
jgi:hypothetical protein